MVKHSTSITSARSLMMVSELDNIAPMCEVHNKQKGTLPLEDFRVSLRLKQFFSEGDGLTLKHLLTHLQKNKD